MSYVAGIDVSTHSVNIVLLDEDSDQAEGYEFPLPHKTVWENCQFVSDLPLRRSLWDYVYLTGIEDPHGRHNLGTAKKLGMITGSVLAIIPPEVQVIPLPPTEWKRETCGVPMAKKDKVAHWVFGTWPNIPAVVTQDTLDAYAIAWAARAINARAVEASA